MEVFTKSLDCGVCQIWRTLLILASLVAGDYIMQEQSNCDIYHTPENKVYDQKGDIIVTSHSPAFSNQYYSSSMHCTIVLIGDRYYQWMIAVDTLDVDKRVEMGVRDPAVCHDYLKIYDGPRADNARLLTPQAGLCGKATLPSIRFLSTCQRSITIEFFTDGFTDNMNGFTLTLRQQPWRNMGSLYPSGGFVTGVTSTCFLSELETTWFADNREAYRIEQEQSSGKDYKYGSIWCYQCGTCPIDTFDENLYPFSAKAGCYRCLKEFDISAGIARRVCQTERDYINMKQYLKYPENEEMVGCSDHPNEYNKVIRYCYCNEDYCNKAPSSDKFTWLIISLINTVILLWYSKI